MAATATRSVSFETSAPASVPVIPEDIEKLRIHMVGIGGCGMSGLASVLLHRGARVTGSDRSASRATERLAQRGISFSTQQTAESLPGGTQLVVISAAIPADHAERLEAHRRGIPVIRYSQLLGILMARYEGVAVAGTHGKSTTTAWLAYVLREAGLDPSFVVGATVGQLGGGSGVGRGPHFVAEACEYDRSFLNLTPKVAVLLNIEEDHLDCYRDLAAIEYAFSQFARRVPSQGLVLVNGDDPRCVALAQRLTLPVATFGLGAHNRWRAAALALSGGCYAFDVFDEEQALGRVELRIPGQHNVYNALAAVAAAHRCGVAWERIAHGLGTFRGADRRLERRGEVGGVPVLDDYAHHPTEIRATLRAARERYRPKRLWCVFQPHQHSRTRFLLADFAESLSQADEVIVPDIYFVRDSQRERERVSAEDLVSRIRASGRAARYVSAFGDIVALLAAESRPGDVLLTMGAGDIWKVADELVQRAGGDLPD
jgi:UDP-N-acetylmuramate--alanine ligase